MDDLHEKIEALASVVAQLQMQVDTLSSRNVSINKDGIPVGTTIEAEINDKVVKMEVEKTGYRVKSYGEDLIAEGIKYHSLSKAAESLSGIKRKSGWVFWKDSSTGRTLKDLYKG